MGLLQNLNTILWLFGLFCVISNTAAQSQSKRSSRITSSRTSFGTNVKSPSASSSASSAAASGVNFDCPEEFGYYPHPTDCTQYYVCVFGGALLESCTGGLMYSHELQTCDWPRNVGCEVVDTHERRPKQQQLQQHQQQQQQTNANQHVPSRVRFGSAFTSPQEVRGNQQSQQVLKATVPPQYHRQPPQVIQAQVQTIPPPPELKVSPNPIVTSRGQPKHLLEAQEEIAKLYADAHETLPPVEEEESDRQQRVYRGQPSTVSQVQKDRDGIIHQASINAIPNNDKFSSYNFGNQYRTDMLLDLDLLNNGLDNVFVIDSKDLDLNAHKRVKRDLGLAEKSNENIAKSTSENNENEEQNQQEQEVQIDKDIAKAEETKVVKYSSKFSSNADETMLEIESLVKELYGPEVKCSTTDDLMELMETRVNQELRFGKMLEEVASQVETEAADSSTENLQTKQIIKDEKTEELVNESEQLNDILQQESLKETVTEADNSKASLNLDEDQDNSHQLKSKEQTKSSRDLETQTEVLTSLKEPEDLEYVDTGDNVAAESTRRIRQLRPYHGASRSQWSGGIAGTNYRSIDASHYQQPQSSYSFGTFNPYLSPPSTPTYAALNSVNAQYKPNTYQQSFPQTTNYKQQKPKVVYTGYNLSLPPPKNASPLQEEFRPVVGKYYSPSLSGSTARPAYLKNTDLLPYILKSLQELKEQRKKQQAENFSYFHLDNQPTTLRTLSDFKSSTQKVTPNSHYSQISTVGGFYNNKNLQHQSNKHYQNNNPYISNIIPTSTESNYFKYNFVGNQKMKNFYSTLKPQSSSFDFTTPSPLNSNFNIVNAPKLQGNYVDFGKFSSGISYSNVSTSVPESYNPFSSLATKPFAETSSSKPLKMQFNLPEFLSNLQTQDMAHLNPTVADMLKYFKAVNKPSDSSKSTVISTKIRPSRPIPNTNEIQLKPIATTKRPIKGYESFLNSFNKPQSSKTSTTRKPYNPNEYYDEYEEEEEENESGGIDADEDIKPPSEMPPYMPMTETMAPPRSQMMPEPKPTENPNKHQLNYNTGYFDATTTRRPLFSNNFEQFYQPQTNTPANPNQIPSFINFPTDYFQEIKQKLPSRPQDNAQIPQLSVKPTISTHIRLTTAKPTTTSTSTTTTTTTTEKPMTTTTTTPRIRYTIRPNRHRGQNRWQPSSSSSSATASNSTQTNMGTKTMTLDQKEKPKRKRPTSLASSSKGSSINMDMNGQNHSNRDIEYQQQQQLPQQQQQQQQHRQQPQQQQNRQQQQTQQQQTQQQQYQQPIRSQAPQQSTYRPLEIFTTPAPQYKPQSKPQAQERPTYQSNQQPLVYNADYDDDLIAQIEQDNAYDQPTRPPTSRINSNSNRNRGNSAYQGDRDAAPVTSNRGTHPPRTRPTLKPSGTIVSKAQEFIDIYKYPPSRPEPLYPQPQPDKTAAKCRKDVCLLPDCYCGGRDIPGDLPVEQVPQIVLITFDDSVNDLNKQLYIDLFEKGRVNPNGCPITATFYVSHEWTDYSQVQNLYSDGHEMASHTISHSFGEQFSQKKWTREIAGQREILAAYGGVKLSDVRGMRAPFLSVGGNKMYKMLYDSNFTYDSSMPVYENRPPSWPYTLDYKIFHDCMIPPCPTKSYPGVWQVPMVMWQDLNGGRCSMGDACSNPSEAEGVTKMIMKNFERHYTTNRAPFGLFYHAAWFTQPHHKEGFIKFLDTINAMPDVWIVTNWQALQWVRDPTPLSRINSFQPFQCDYSDRPKRCNNPKVCNLWHKSGVRYMKTCQPCPDIYPWTGKTGIRSSRIDNDIEDSA